MSNKVIGSHSFINRGSGEQLGIGVLVGVCVGVLVGVDVTVGVIVGVIVGVLVGVGVGEGQTCVAACLKFIIPENGLVKSTTTVFPLPIPFIKFPQQS